MAGWERDAAAYRHARGGYREAGLKYGPHDRQTVDVFLPDGPDDRRVVVMIVHGGYWRSLDPSMFSHWAAGANRHGYIAALAGYRLCPEATLSDIVADVRAAALFIHRRFGRRLVVAGHSAGGHLAAALAATDWAAFGGPSADMVGGCLAVSGLFDLVPLTSTSINTQLRLDEPSARALSPAYWPLPRRVNCVALVGEAESAEYLRQSRLLADNWAAAGAETRFATVPQANHFTAPAGLCDPESETVATLLSLASAT